MPGRFFAILLLLSLCVTAATGAGTGHDSSILSIALRADDSLLASGSQNGEIRLFTSDLRPVRVLAGHRDGVTALVFNADGHKLYSASMDRTVHIWDVDSGKSLGTLGPLTDDVLSIALSPDGRRLAVAPYDARAVIYDLATSQQLPSRIQGHTVDYSPDGRTLVTATLDGTIHTWDADGKPLTSWKGHTKCPNRAVYSPDGKWIATSADHLKLWDATTHAMVADLDAKIQGPLTQIAWTRDSRHLTVCTLFRGAVRFDATTSGWVGTQIAPPLRIQCLATTGRRVAIGNLEGTVETLTSPEGRVLAARIGHIQAPPIGPQHVNAGSSGSWFPYPNGGR